MEASCYFVEQNHTEVTAFDLLMQIADQDQVALEKFYERYNKLVFSFVLRVLNCQAESEEVTLEVFWQVWQQARNYNKERGSVSSWLIMMARSRAIDRKRMRDRNGNNHTQPVEALEDSSVVAFSHSPEDRFYTIERSEAVRHALAEMSDKQRRAIELAYFNGLSQSEIATELQEPLGTVKTRIRTGMQILREKLKRFL